ncbi:hypothetical protein [Chryseobacterium sp. FH1]|uniref:hypothetical protein n=1 Tax=Chryseobacterium sp. FH1 TaxID=1233951 RepID=UPI0004E33E5F|nr:hypothetical protein [Chryseobacterium sp. FH1]KFC19337.1 hypothetical protein IO90_08490 [Chryseobacterium sp. FH1]
MEIREKILLYFTKNDISFTEIGKELGISDVSVGHYLHGKRKMPMDFLVWFIRKYNPDLKSLFYEENENIVAEEKNVYFSNNDKAEVILIEMKRILKKHLDTK